MPYQYPMPRRQRAASPEPQALETRDPVAEELPPGQLYVDGKKATDIEYRVAVALRKYKLHYEFQFSLFGGRLRKGGQIIDFVVWAPFPIPCYVQGEYWHSGQLSLDDKLKHAEAERYFARPAVILWGKNLQTQAEANSAVAAAFL